jgi:ABC-type sugar transport system ATPase subunit
MSAAIALEGRGLTKAFAGVTVVDDVHLSVRAGEIRAVVGENGAGKSTVMHLLSGVIRPDAGEIRVAGAPRNFASPRSAAQAGIAIVHQELHLAPTLSVVDNLMLVRPPVARAVRRGSRAELDYVRSITCRVGLNVDPQAAVASLTVAQCQLLEIAKALALRARVLILDEPTSALQPAEAQRLLVLVGKLRQEGIAILYVSHAIEEILRIADNVSVLRDGRLVGDRTRSELDRSTLIRMMVDRPVATEVREPAAARDDVVLAADGVASVHVSGLTFELRAGEILGFAGLMGAGMYEAALALCGEHAVQTGTLRLDGRTRRFRSPHDALRAGISLVAEDRKRGGIVPRLSVCDNLHVGRYWRHQRAGFVSPAQLRRAAQELVHRFQIRLASLDQPVATLSGGNQQKVLIARCVQSDPRVLIVASPTRGVDIGAREAIHSLLLGLAARGTAIILISAELQELLQLAHRIAVFSAGRMVGALARDAATPTRIMELALASTAGEEG